MSHFTVAVITDDPKKLSAIMEPFCEGIEVPRYISTTVEDLQKQYEEYKQLALTQAVLDVESNPELKDKINTSKEILESTNNFGNGTWTTKDFFKWYHDKEDDDFDEEGNLYSTYNQNSKWDWYTVGGRWKNYLVLKNGTRADQAKIKDVYFHGHSERPIDEHDPVTVLREEQHPLTKYLEEAAKRSGEGWDEVLAGKTFYRPEYYQEKYKTRENYIEKMLAFSTYAVITADREWHAPGDMGWFGCSSESIEEGNSFEDQYYDSFIKDANPEHYIIIVDCHI